MATGLYTDERTFWHSTGLQALNLPVGGWVQVPNAALGADSPDSKRRILSLAEVSGLAARCARPVIVPASRDDCLRIHTEAYLDRFQALSDAGGGDLGPGAAFGPGGFEIALVSAGLAKAAVADVLAGTVSNAFALCRPCGHHCLPDQPMGACLLANIAIALEAARAGNGALRVAVLDWDVHHGNGTQAIYYARADTLTISLHQDRCFPFGYGGEEDRGEGEGLGHNINVPLPPGSGHAAYLHAFDAIAGPAIRAFAPDLIVVASGLDGGATDPLGRMLMHSGTFRALTERVLALADACCGRRVVVVHEGGYSESYAPFCGHAVLEALTGVSGEVTDPALPFLTEWQPREEVVAFQKQWIDQLADGLGQVTGGEDRR